MDDEKGTPSGFVEALDSATIEDVVEVARRDLQDPPSDEVLLEAFLYYHKHDAFLPRIGAPEPLPFEEAQRKQDREFYDRLGEERANEQCRAKGCSRGAVKYSVLCRVHHFESVKKRSCPFSD